MLQSLSSYGVGVYEYYRDSTRTRTASRTRSKCWRETDTGEVVVWVTCCLCVCTLDTVGKVCEAALTTSMSLSLGLAEVGRLIATAEG
jgi:hypothetical protein